MQKFYLSLLPEELRTLHADAYKTTPWRQKIGKYMMMLYFLFFAAFVGIPERVWEGLMPDVFYSKIYPQYIVHLLEGNVIKQTLFPMSAYALWSIAPVFITIEVVLFCVMLWPFNEFKYFLIRKKGLKNTFWISIIVIIGYIGILHTDGSHNLVSSVLKPYQYKFTYFLFYITGAYVFSAGTALLIIDIRARLTSHQDKFA